MKPINVLTVIKFVTILGLAACSIRTTPTSGLPTPLSVIPTTTPEPILTWTPTLTPNPTATETATPTPISGLIATPCSVPPVPPPSEPIGQILFSAAECGAEICDGISDSSIYSINSDGSDLQLVFEGQGSIHELALSPDGTKLAFTEGYGWGGYRVHILDLESGNTWPLRTDLLLQTRMPRWVSDDQLLCIAGQGDFRNIFLVDVNGRRWQQLTDYHHPNIGFLDLSVSPDGTQFLFVKYDSVAGTTVYRVNIDGTELQKMISFPDNRSISTNWSPSGNWVAIFPVHTDLTTPVPIYLGDRLGVEMIGIAQLTGSPQLLTWEPDESELLFFSCASTSDPHLGSVIAVRKDGSGTRTIREILGPENINLCLFPVTLSPHRALFAFSPYVSDDLISRYGLYIIDMDTGCWRQPISKYSISSLLWIP